MRILVLGCNGQLGTTLAETVPQGAEVVGLDLPAMDITNVGALHDSCRELRPNVIVNAAAYTAVDKAESELELATAVNAEGPRNIALAAQATDARLIHLSTDFVFDGASSKPYRSDAEPRPLNVYGRTKRDGEVAVLAVMPQTAVVIRTSWLYSKTGNNFVKTMLKLMREKDELRVITDQTGTPTWTNSLAEAIWGFVQAAEHSGLFHWSDAGQASWWNFAVAVQEEAVALGLLTEKIPIHPIRTSEYPAAAARPAFSVLDCSATQAVLNLKPEQWRKNLRQMLEGMTA